MATRTKLMRASTPMPLVRLAKLIDALDPDEHPDAVVYHHNGELVVEEPQATLLDEDDE